MILATHLIVYTLLLAIFVINNTLEKLRWVWEKDKVVIYPGPLKWSLVFICHENRKSKLFPILHVKGEAGKTSLVDFAHKLWFE